MGVVERVPVEAAADIVSACLARDGRPIIVHGAMRNWPAFARWSFQYLRDKLGDDAVVATDCINNPSMEWKTDVRSYIDYILDHKKHRPPQIATDTILYAYGYRPFDKHVDLSIEYSPPPFLENWLDALSEPLRARTNYRWLLLSAPGATSDFHQDFMSTHAWLGQIRGRKRCQLVDPSWTDSASDKGANGNGAAPENASIAWPSDGAVECCLEEGEILIIPSRWHHRVVTETPSITLSHNFVNASNFAEFVDELIRTLPRALDILNRSDRLRRELRYDWRIATTPAEPRSEFDVTESSATARAR